MINRSDLMLTEHRRLIYRLIILYRLRRFIQGAAIGLFVGLAGALGFGLIAVLSGLGIRYGLGKIELIKILISSGCVSTTIFAFSALFWPSSTIRIGRFFDQYFDLKDRLSTSVEILANKSTVQNNLSDLDFLQIEDAVLHAMAIKPRSGFLFPFSRVSIFYSVLICLFVVIGSYIGEPYFNSISQRQFIQRTIANQIEALEQLQQTNIDNKDIPEADKREVDRILQKTIQDLQRSNTAELAVAALTQAEEELKALENSETNAQVQSLQQLGNQFSKNNQDGEEKLRDLMENLSKADLPAASQDLHDLNLKNLTQDEANSLAERLSNIADSLSESDPGLSETLKNAAEAIQNGDLQSAQQTLSEAADKLDELGNQHAINQAVQQAAAQISKSADQIIQSEISQQYQSNADITSSNQPSSSENTQSGISSNQGQDKLSGSSEQTGSNTGDGSGKGSANNGNAIGSEASENPIDQTNGTRDKGELNFEPLSNPQRLGGSSSLDVYLPDSGAGDGEILGLENTSPGNPGVSNVPYTQILPTYTEAYRQAVESGTIPLSLRDLVRDYFSNLEP